MQRLSRPARRLLIVSFVLVGVCIAAASVTEAAGVGQPTDWQRFYYYPYVYYPHNFRRDKPLDHLYYRYPASLRIPVYNKQWYNFYPSPKPYYRGHHFILDVF